MASDTVDTARSFDLGWSADPYCKRCGEAVNADEAYHYCCNDCTETLGLRDTRSRARRTADRYDWT